MHDFNGHEVNGIHGLNGKKGYDEALYLVNNRHDFKGIHDFKGNFPYDDFSRKTHARLYMDFRCPRASEITKKRPEILKNARNTDFWEIPIFGKAHGKGPFT